MTQCTEEIAIPSKPLVAGPLGRPTVLVMVQPGAAPLDRSLLIGPSVSRASSRVRSLHPFNASTTEAVGI